MGNGSACMERTGTSRSCPKDFLDLRLVPRVGGRDAVRGPRLWLLGRLRWGALLQLETGDEVAKLLGGRRQLAGLDAHGFDLLIHRRGRSRDLFRHRRM